MKEDGSDKLGKEINVFLVFPFRVPRGHQKIFGSQISHTAQSGKNAKIIEITTP